MHLVLSFCGLLSHENGVDLVERDFEHEGVQLEDRFGMVFQVLDKDYVARVRQERGYGVNPWTTHTRFLVSHRLLIDAAYTELAVRALHAAYGLDKS